MKDSLKDRLSKFKDRYLYFSPHLEEKLSKFTSAEIAQFIEKLLSDLAEFQQVMQTIDDLIYLAGLHPEYEDEFSDQVLKRTVANAFILFSARENKINILIAGAGQDRGAEAACLQLKD